MSENPEQTNLTHESIVAQGVESLKPRLQKLKEKLGSVHNFTGTEFVAEGLVPATGMEDVIKDPGIQKLAKEALEYQYKLGNFEVAQKLQSTFGIDTSELVASDAGIKTDLVGAVVEYLTNELSSELGGNGSLHAMNLAESFNLKSVFQRLEMKGYALKGLKEIFLTKYGEPETIFHFKSIFGITDEEFVKTGREAANEFKRRFDVIGQHVILNLIGEGVAEEA